LFCNFFQKKNGVNISLCYDDAMKKNVLLSINNVSIAVLDKPVVQDISLSILSGSIHAIMGPNGSGKSTLAYVLAGHPHYTITSGSITFQCQDLAAMSIDERARQGVFLSFQHPIEIPGVSVDSFLYEAYKAVKRKSVAFADFQHILHERCMQLSIDHSFLKREVNVGFSGGEKKRFELLQLLMLQPQCAILDEIDSGLDIDSLKIIASGIERARKENPAMAIILITHYQRILDYIVPDYVHVISDGRMQHSGDALVAHMLEAQGYDGFKNSNV
jgi:Fe-S cluster assembly ATP-binding protein